MPLNKTPIIKSARLKKTWITDLYDVLTGVMTDQDIAIARNMTVLGSYSPPGGLFQSTNTAAVPLTVRAAPNPSINAGISVMRFQDSTSTTLCSIEPSGKLIGAPFSTGGTISIGTLNVSGTSTHSGALAWKVVRKSTSTTLLTSETFAIATAAITLTLPQTPNDGTTIVVVNASAGSVSVAASSGDKVGNANGFGNDSLGTGAAGVYCFDANFSTWRRLGSQTAVF